MRTRPCRARRAKPKRRPRRENAAPRKTTAKHRCSESIRYVFSKRKQAGSMTTPAAHLGVAQDDVRNRGPIALFRPREATRESARDLSRSLPHASAAEIETRVDGLMARIARGPVKPP